MRSKGDRRIMELAGFGWIKEGGKTRGKGSRKRGRWAQEVIASAHDMRGAASKEFLSGRHLHQLEPDRSRATTGDITVSPLFLQYFLL